MQMQRNDLGFYPPILECSEPSTEQTLMEERAYCCLLSVCLFPGNPNFPVRPRRVDREKAGVEGRGKAEGETKPGEQEGRMALPAMSSCCLEWGRGQPGLPGTPG